MAADSDLTTRARDVLAKLDEADLFALIDVVDGGELCSDLDLSGLFRLGLVERNEDDEDEGSVDANALGRECARLLAEEGDQS